jgi:hypothetical protein
VFFDRGCCSLGFKWPEKCPYMCCLTSTNDKLNLLKLNEVICQKLLNLHKCEMEVYLLRNWAATGCKKDSIFAVFGGTEKCCMCFVCVLPFCTFCQI